jgi:hypothetical protein
MAKSRYPGPKPFSDDDKDLFFGRSEEKESLINLVRSNRLNILFGRSGNGKSSLIHAALIPYFEAEHYKIIEIRVQPVLASFAGKRALLDQVIKELEKYLTPGSLYFEEVLAKSEGTSLWQYFKTLQWDVSKEGYEGIILIIDQFEELFNFNTEQYMLFAEEFSEVVYNRTPFKFQEALNEKLKDKEGNFVEKNKYKIEFVKTDFFSSFLIGIRSDRLYLLDELGDMIPMIFNNRFRLDHLNPTKVDEAIKLPASLDGDFISPVFTVADEVIQEIKDYLFDHNTALRQSYFETFQLQIICQFIENKVVVIAGDPDTYRDAFVEGKIVVTKNILSKQIDEIIKDYYESVIKGINPEGIASPHQFAHQLFSRYLIEKKLIDIKTSNRICLDKTSIEPLGIDDSLLNRLTDSKIIRKEINTVSGESFEISHDSLLKPILAAANSDKLGNLESQLFKYYTNKIDSFSWNLRWRFKKNVLPKILNKEGNLQVFNMENFPEDMRKIIQQLVLDYIIVKKKDSGEKDFYIINEAFRSAIIKQQNRDYALRQNLLAGSMVILLVFLVFSLFDGVRKSRQHQIDNSKVFLFKNVLLFSPPTNNSVDTVGSVKRLLLLSSLYKTIKPDTANLPVAEKYLTSFFNSYDFIGKRLVVPGLYPTSFNYNSENQLLVQYSNIDPTSLNDVSKGDVSSYLYDRYGKLLDHHAHVYKATFGPASELVILKKDSLIIFKNNTEQAYSLKFEKAVNPVQKIGDVFILGIKDKIIYCMISPARDLSKSAPRIRSNDQVLYNPYASEQSSPVFEQIDYTGNVLIKSPPDSLNDFFQSRVPGGAERSFSKKSGNKELSYNGRVISLKWAISLHKDTVKKDTLDNLILDADFSKSGDSIFVNDGSNLTILDKKLNKLSRFRNQLSKDDTNTYPNIVAYRQASYVVLVNLTDPSVKSVKTLDPVSIINYVDGAKHTISWQQLTEKDKKNYGYVNP